jgi:sugar lactone lactonase YvrE
MIIEKGPLSIFRYYFNSYLNSIPNMLKYFLFFVLTSCLSCQSGAIEKINLKDSKDLIPEGITINGQTAFMSSIHKNKIVQFNLKDNKIYDFIEPNLYGFKSGVGLFSKDTLLFALTNDLINADSLTSTLFVFDIKRKKPIKTFQLKDSIKHFLNDLTITDLNQIFITDSKQHKIYKLDYPNGQIEEYLPAFDNKYPNGITLSKDNKKLFIASENNGLRIVDIATKRILNRPSLETGGLDGIKYHDGKIYAIRNADKSAEKHELLAISLTNNEEKIEKVETLIEKYPLFNVPTTLDIANGYIYMIANSQMDNLNQSTNKIIDSTILTNTYILKIKCKENK